MGTFTSGFCTRSKGSHVGRRQESDLAQGQTAEPDGSETDALELEDIDVHGRKHPSDLAIPPLGERDAKPDVGLGSAMHHDLGMHGPVIEPDPFLQSRHGPLGDFSLDLHLIDPLDTTGWMGQRGG